jgi:pimeloyl-ACP methyl ester carboxylesterase
MTDREPLLLLHGVTMSANAWADVIPLLTDHHDVIAPTTVGHRGGPPLVGKATWLTGDRPDSV